MAVTTLKNRDGSVRKNREGSISYYFSFYQNGCEVSGRARGPDKSSSRKGGKEEMG
jgi:hypothetical protein